MLCPHLSSVASILIVCFVPVLVRIARPCSGQLMLTHTGVPAALSPGALVSCTRPGIGALGGFQFTFDRGDAWTHRCVVREVKSDPLYVVGCRPETPLPSWDWGSIPDQYGRGGRRHRYSKPSPRQVQVTVSI